MVVRIITYGALSYDHLSGGKVVQPGKPMAPAARSASSGTTKAGPTAGSLTARQGQRREETAGAGRSDPFPMSGHIFNVGNDMHGHREHQPAFVPDILLEG